MRPRARRYDLASAPPDARLFAQAARGHRPIENRLHWGLDVVFRDDRCRLRTGHGPPTMASSRNLVRTASGRRSLKLRRKRAACNGASLHALLRQTA